MATILVVDDRPTNRQFLLTLLGYTEHRLLEAADGAQELEIVKAEHPDLVITDILMPTMDGYEFVQRLRADPELADTHVIFYSATYSVPEASRMARTCGVQTVLPKPSEPQVIFDAVNRELGFHVGAEITVPEDQRVHGIAELHELRSIGEKIREYLVDLEGTRQSINKIATRGAELSKEQARLQPLSERFAENITALQTLTARLTALEDLSLRLVSTRSPEKMVEQFVQAAIRIAGCHQAAICVLDVSEGSIAHLFASGLDVELLRAGALDRTRLPGSLLDLNEPLVRGGTGEFVDMLAAGHPPVKTFIGVAIRGAEHLYGWLYFANKRSAEEFNPDDVRVVHSMATQFAVMYENSSLYHTVQRHAAELQISRGRLAGLIATAMDAIITVDEQQRIVLFNAAASQTFGYSAAEMEGEPLDRLIPEGFRAAHRGHIRRFGETGVTSRSMGAPGLVSGVRKNGEEFPMEASISQYVSAERSFFTVVLRDITERQQAEVSIRRLNRVYAVLSGINSLIVRERDRQRLFEEACRIAVEVGQFGLAWIGVVDSQSQLIRPVAMAGPQAEQDLISGARISTRNEEPEGWGTVGQAVRTRGCVWTNDLSATRGMHADLEEFCRRGYRSAISLPLVVNDDCSAVVVLYSKEAGLFNKDELALLAELAKDISFALTFIEQEEKVHYLAYHDPITGLGNRAHLHAKLTQAIDVARGESHSCVLLLANLNNFHDINNTLGHANGDLLLRQVAERIRATLWGSDSVACLGGDEFAILLARLAESGDIDVVLAKITDAMQATFNVASLPVNLEARIGVAVYPDQADSADLLWQRASVALRAAKELHRPQVKYDRGIDHYTPEHLALLGGLRKAIDVNELVLHYQPKLDLQRQCVIGVEALLRWQHPERGLLYPDAFISLAERTSLINPMSTWVLANAMRQGRIWQKSGLELDIAVNLSARNLMDPNITGEIFDIARSSRFPLDRLTLEVTESAIMADPLRGKAALVDLHDRGIRISMDDFGIGQSSLTYLKDLPISQLKIDKSFVIGFQQPRNGAIVRSTIQMAHSMEMGVTAEGIEDEATFRALRELGCDHGQGYFFSKPLPPEKFLDWLHESRWAAPHD